MTNFEKIKNMNIDELADLMDSVSSDCQECPIHEFCDDIRPKIKRMPFCKNVWKEYLRCEVRNND